MNLFKRIIGYLGAVFFAVWAAVDRILNFIGRTTAPEDAEELMNQKLPRVLEWLFSTPWWVPAGLALASFAWMIWITIPRGAAGAEAGLLKQKRLMLKERRLNHAGSNATSTGTEGNKSDVKQSDTTKSEQIPILRSETESVLEMLIEIDTFLAGQFIQLMEDKKFVKSWRDHFRGKTTRMDEYRTQINEINERYKSIIQQIRERSIRYEYLLTLVGINIGELINLLSKFDRIKKELSEAVLDAKGVPPEAASRLMTPIVNECEQEMNKIGQQLRDKREEIRRKRRRLTQA